MFRMNTRINTSWIALLLCLFSFSLYAEPTAQALFRHPNDPIGGNPRGKVTIVEFFDYQCSHCVNMAPVIDGIIRSNPSVRVVFKEFPIRGDISIFAARAALAANMQGKYQAFNRALFNTNQALSEDVILGIAQSVGLNMQKLKKDMNSMAVYQALRANSTLARDLNLQGTPVYFIGKTNAQTNKDVNFIFGEIGQDKLQNIVDDVGR